MKRNMIVNKCCSFRRLNAIRKGAENILKYKDMTVEIRCMWNVKTNVTPVIIRATGTISKLFRKYIKTYR
jgi:hypothetical protein